MLAGQASPSLTYFVFPPRPGAPPPAQTALHVAVRHGHADAVAVLLAGEGRRALPALPDGHGRTPAHVAALYGHETLLRDLLEAEPAAAAALDHGRHPPLHYACYHGRDASVEVLLELGAWRADGEARFGALHAAAANGHAGCLETLVEALGEQCAVGFGVCFFFLPF